MAAVIRFDALSMKRSYKEAWPVAKIQDFIRESAGSHLDAGLVEAFMDIMPSILAIKGEWDARETSMNGNFIG